MLTHPEHSSARAPGKGKMHRENSEEGMSMRLHLVVSMSMRISVDVASKGITGSITGGKRIQGCKMQPENPSAATTS